MGLFEAFGDIIGAVAGSIGRVLTPKSNIEDIEFMSEQSLARIDEAFKRVSVRMSEIDKTMRLFTKSMEVLAVAAASKPVYEEPVFTHGSIEEALRRR